MTDRERLIELIKKGEREYLCSVSRSPRYDFAVDYLIANGVVFKKKAEAKLRECEGK